MKKIVAVLLAVCLSLGAFATVASPEPIEFTQPDGSVIRVRMMGDEFHHYYANLNGTPLRRTAEGLFVADASVKQEPAAARSARRVAQARYAAKSGFPLSGSPKSIVILVNFADLKFTYKLEDFQKLLTQPGYSENNGVGSCRDYFIANSDSLFQPQFDCYGPVTLSRGYAYYGGNSGSRSSIHADQMVVEACNLVAEQGVDFTQYDTDNDGRIDNVFIYFAGHNEAEGADASTIWPHRSVVLGNERVHGKLIYDYACTSELRGRSGSAMCGIGTFCHEFGHVLGLPDYYDTGYDQYTIGTWDIMCSGNYNGNGKTPPSYSAGERFQLGWLTPIQLEDAGTYTLEPLATSQQAYLIAARPHNLSWESADPSEYFLLENRQNVGWDAPSSALPATGMLIWHIDYSSAAWGANAPNNSTPLRYDIEEAGGAKGYSALSDPFPGSMNITQFTPVLHNGTIVEQPLTNIAQEGKNIVFTFKSSDSFMFLPTELDVLQSTYDPDTKKSVTPASKLIIVGEGLDPQQEVSLSISGSGFSLSKDSLTWLTSLTATVALDSTMEQAIYVRYAPKKQVCDVQRGTITVRQDKITGTYSVRGTSPRPTLIGIPQLTRFEEVTPTSFKAYWKPETDAEYYYVTLYHMEEGQETTMESFEGFDDEATVFESGWYTSFYRTTSKAKSEGAVSMWFKENNEHIISPLYALPVTEVSFWLNAPATSDTEVGMLVLTCMGEARTFSDTIDIHKSTKQYTYTRSLDLADGIRRFEVRYTSFGGEGVCLDAFSTTFNQKTVYTYKGRERSIAISDPDDPERFATFYAYDLLPNTDYYVRLQCSEAKGCSEHLSALSTPEWIHTKAGEAVDSKHLTLDFDSISYDPATHVVYLPQALVAGNLCIYSPRGELVKRIPVSPTVNVVPLPDAELQRGAVYLIKYLPEDKLNRKSPWIKILFE